MLSKLMPASLILVLACTSKEQTARMSYPETKTVDTVDHYFGTDVADPYRWLENDTTKETAEWVKAQKKIYWPELNLRKEPREFAKQLTNHERDGSNFNERPSFSPTGNEIAIFTDRSDFTEVYLISAADGKRIKAKERGRAKKRLMSLRALADINRWLAGNALPAAAE